MEGIKVSVVCLTYNHEAYIREALEGFVSQEADFAFEVIVHDDASTDGTAAVIREYAARYPGIIRPVYEKDNLYQRGVNIWKTVIYPLIRGEYAALCEGDDCWTDPRKLSRQVAALEAHPEADICACSARVVRDGRKGKYKCASLRDRMIRPEEVIVGGGRFVATCTLMCRSSMYTSPAPFRDITFTDYSLQVQGALRGGMVYLAAPMAVRRLGVPGSWTERHKGRAHHEIWERNRLMLRQMDSLTGGRFHDAAKMRIAFYDFDAVVLDRKYWKLLSPRFLALIPIRAWKSLGRLLRRTVMRIKYGKD